MPFSERHGFAVPRNAFQKDDLDKPSRNRLINALINVYLWRITPSTLGDNAEENFQYLIVEFFKETIDKATARYDAAAGMLTKWASSCKWFSLMDLLEFVVARKLPGYYGDQTTKYFLQECNRIFEEEKIAYRFVKSQITPIVEPVEIQAIEEALNVSDPFGPVRNHLKRALELYSDRKNPDYRNTIKEAISAVEAASKIISGKSSATLSDAIRVIEKKHGMHAALKDALNKLYGYTSDKGGIRHSLLDDPNVGHAEAKLMLVGCSAFCNYLIEQYGDTK